MPSFRNIFFLAGGDEQLARSELRSITNSIQTESDHIIVKLHILVAQYPTPTPLCFDKQVN